MATTVLEQEDVGAANQTVTTEGEDLLQIVTFRLATEEYGVDVMRVQEIILPGRTTRLPQVPDYITGLINLRGHVIPVIDLRKRFYLPAGKPTDHSRIIVLNIESRTIGIVVDQVNEVLRVERGRIEKAPAGLVGKSDAYIEGLVRLETKLFILLCADALDREAAMSEALPA